MKRDKVIQKIVYAVLVIITILFPYNVFAATNSSSDADPNEYAPKCKSYLDRDYNASENIMFEGIKKYMESLI